MTRVTTRGLRRRSQRSETREKRRRWVKSTTAEERAVQNVAIGLVREQVRGGKEMTDDMWDEARESARWKASVPGEDFASRMKRLEAE